ncbi:hypothetical protein HHI36_006563 [Cryptolaemus montrouzieri]|uniref:Uncharacterized protein n=1 Tax=Cryptolaemus montrouzieri TaxID=559131 RepID=A0ABD2NXZ0_9CUCU
MNKAHLLIKLFLLLRLVLLALFLLLSIPIPFIPALNLGKRNGLGEMLFLRYLQRWGKDFLRRRLDWTLDEMLGNPVQRRHLQSALCPCQYVEEVIIRKASLTDRDCCPRWSRFLDRQGLY